MDTIISQNCKEVRHGSFSILDGYGSWNGDDSIHVRLDESSMFAYREGIWNPQNRDLRTRYETAVTGMVIAHLPLA